VTRKIHFQVDDGWRNADTSSYREGRYSTTTTPLRANSVSVSLHLDRCLISHPNIESRFLATSRIPRSLASDAASAAIGELEAEEPCSGQVEGVMDICSSFTQLIDNLPMSLDHLALDSNVFIVIGIYKLVTETLPHLEAQMQGHRTLSLAASGTGGKHPYETK
jgi:hypothetical protein